MARLRRSHVPGASYYVILRGHRGRKIFCSSADYETFGKLVEHYASRCQVRVHAFCWTAHAAHLAVRLSSVPLGGFIQRIAARHARLVNLRCGHRGHLFGPRYWTVRLDRPADLPEVVRYIHFVPVRAGLADDLDKYPWSSHPAYLGLTRISWLATGEVLHLLESPGPDPCTAYRQLMRAEMDHHAGRPVPGAGRAAAQAEDTHLPLRLVPSRRRRADGTLLNSIIDLVAKRLCVSREAILSPSRQRRLSLARALVAWHAMHHEIATLSEVARYFRRSPSTLCVGVGRYRRLRRDLFEESIACELQGASTAAVAEGDNRKTVDA